MKRTISNGGDAGRNADAGQAAATRKRIESNVCDAGRNADAGQAAATLKRKISNVGDGIGDGDGAGFTCRALDEGGLGFVVKDSIRTAIGCVGCSHRNRSQAAAIRKCIDSNACDAGRNADTGQAAATIKRNAPNACDAGRNSDAGQATATRKRISSNGGDGIGDGDGAGFTCRALDEGGLRFVVKDVIRTAIVRVSCSHRNRSQAAAIRKRRGFNPCDAGRNADAGQAAATRKRKIFNACDAGRDGDAGQATATLKRTIFNGGDGIGDGDGAGFTCRALDEGGLGFVVKDSIRTAIVRVGWIHANAGQAAAIIKRRGSNACDAGRDGDAGQGEGV